MHLLLSLIPMVSLVVSTVIEKAQQLLVQIPVSILTDMYRYTAPELP